MRTGSRDRRDIKALLWYALPFVLILVILASLSTVTTNVTYQLMLEQRMTYYARALEDTMEIIDRTLASVDSLSEMLHKQETVTSIMYATKESARVAAMLRLTKEPVSYRDTSNIIEGYLIYAANTGAIVTDKRIILRPAQHYDTMLRYGEFSYAEWVETVLTMSNQARFLPAQVALPGATQAAESFILYVKPYINLSNARVVGQIAFYLKEQEILSMMDAMVNDERIIIQLLAADTLLSGTGDAAMEVRIDIDGELQQINSETYYLANAVSAQYPLRLVIALPQQVLQEQCRQWLRGVDICLALLFVLVILVAVFTVLRNKEPLLGISRHVSGSGDMRSIERAFTQLQTDRASLTYALDAHRLQMREALLRQIIHGFTGSETDMEAQLEYVGVQLGGERFAARAVYLLVDEQSAAVDREELQSAAYRQTLVDMVVREQGALLYPLLLEERNQLALLLYTDGDLSPLSNVYQTLKSRHGIGVHFYVGGQFTQLHHAERSFQEARRLMLTDTSQTERFLIVGGEQTWPDVFAYSARDEERLINLIERADPQQIDELLTEIYQNNFEKRAQSAQMCELLYYRMVATLVHAPHSVPLIDSTLLAPRGDCEPRVFFAAFRRHIEAMCTQAEQDKQQARQQLDDEMITFIQNNFANSEISMTMLAMRYGRSESYVSQRIKKLIGQPFSSYLEQLRIAQAKALLEEGKLGIAEIGEQVGYNSASAFGRAYRRVVGCTPSEYQQYGRKNL